MNFTSGIGNYFNLTSNSSTLSCVGDGVLGVSLGNTTFGNAFAITYTDTSGILEIGFVLENGIDDVNTQTFTVTDFYHIVSLIVNGTTITEMIDGLINWTGTYDVYGNVTLLSMLLEILEEHGQDSYQLTYQKFLVCLMVVELFGGFIHVKHFQIVRLIINL